MPEKLNLQPENQPKKETAVEGIARLKQENERLRAQNEELKHDSLTGLLDRRQFYQELFRLTAEEGKLTVAMIDLNYLNYFNHLGRGHKGGDEALKNLVQALQETEGSFIPYRYAGDEFTLIIQNEGKETQEILAQIKNRLKQIKIEGAELPLTISSGLATRQEAIREVVRLSAEEKTGKSQKQLLAETIADLADKRALAAKRENHQEMLLELCRQPDEEKLNQFCQYLLKGAGLTIKDLQKMKAENSEK